MNLEQAYAAPRPALAVPGVEGGRKALAFRSGMAVAGRADLDVRHGHHPRHVHDLFVPESDAGGPVALFLHGGAWQGPRAGKDRFSHLAGGLCSLGMPVAVASYRLCPETEISSIIGDARQLAAHLARRMERPVVAVGHGAGAHLAVCLLATDWMARGFETDIVPAACGISGIYDLRPLIGSSHNEALGLDEMSAFAASPLMWPAPGGKRLRLVVGGEDNDARILQSRALEAAWRGCGVQVSCEIRAEADRAGLLAELEKPQAPLTQAVHALSLGA